MGKACVVCRPLWVGPFGTIGMTDLIYIYLQMIYIFYTCSLKFETSKIIVINNIYPQFIVGQTNNSGHLRGSHGVPAGYQSAACSSTQGQGLTFSKLQYTLACEKLIHISWIDT